MSNNKVMTFEEKGELFKQAKDYMAKGMEDKALKIFRTIPLAPFLAESLKEIYGADYLIKEGFNLIEVEEKYGKEWINQ